MDIILIRHGQTEDNADRIFSTKDTKLTEKGREQIKNTKKIVDTLSLTKYM